MLYNAKKIEEEILEFWDKKKVFQKSIDERPEDKRYAFYDGPPFATGLPHMGNLVASFIKDVVPRYFTMKGYRVERRWGWDCHGLPVENLIEKELGLQTKKDIEEYGVDKFNEACQASVLRYAEEWKKTVRRVGRWVDMKHDYKTMDPSFMESVWWVFSELSKRDLIYKGYKPMHICPRCVTPLSNFEVTQGYKDIKDLSVTVKFKVKKQQTRNKEQLIPRLGGVGVGELYILAWTTTPWTLPGNVLLAIGKEITYVLVQFENELYILAKDRLETVFKEKKYEIVKELSSSELVGLEYEPLFPYYKDTPNAFRIVTADFVSTSDGTGVVHIAPAFGELDFYVGEEQKLPLVQHVGMDGRMKSEVKDFAAMEVKPKDDPSATDIEIIKWLAKENKLFSKEKVEHSYPHCWRCDTPLLNYATTSWFVKVSEFKDELLKNNQKINWVPEHIKEGRFGKWLEGARDWAISRNRFWGTPLPVWECQEKNQNCVNVKVIGSIKELQKLSEQKITDLHKHIVDRITFACEKCGGTMVRTPEVLDCWFESGSMPYGELHYPFENKEKFENCFPAKFIAEGQDQTRGWFYTLHILATALTTTYGRGDAPLAPTPGNDSGPAIISTRGSTPAFENVIVNGIVQAADGKKMSKHLKNYTDPEIIIDTYGADAVRYYLYTSPVMYGENLNFSDSEVKEMYNKLINTLWNVVEFYKMFAGETPHHEYKSAHVLDKWIMSKLHELIKEVADKMELYRIAEASRPIVEFVTELSQWYIRRSRERLKGDNELDKQQCLSTLREVLLQLSKVMAPFTPFIAEKIYQELGKPAKESVHLENWPHYHQHHHDQNSINHMMIVRKIVELGLSIRAQQKIKVRQPLAKLCFVVGGSYVTVGNDLRQNKEYHSIIAEELNVKNAEYVEDVKEAGYLLKEEGDVKVWLQTEITEELKQEGIVRDIIRTINQMRKDQGLTIEDKVLLTYFTQEGVSKKIIEKFSEQIKSAVLATELKEDKNLNFTKDEIVVFSIAKLN